jgi:O-antigen/teichoic acid export membrane protein
VGVWALVGGAVGAAVAGVIASYSVRAPDARRPRLLFDRAALEQGLRYAGPLALAGTLAAAADFALRLVVARRLGTSAVGALALVAGIAALPAGAAGRTLRAVAVPRFARLTADAPALRRAVRATLTEVAVALVPLFAALAAGALGVAELALGARWVDAGAALRILALAGALSVVALGTTPLLEGAAVPRLVPLVAAAQLGGVILLARPLTGLLGLAGAALAWLGGAAAGLLASHALLRRLLGPAPGHAHRIGAIVGAGGAAWVITLMVPVALGGVAGVIVGIASGTAAGVAVTRWADEAWRLGIADDIRVVGVLRSQARQ